MKVSFGGIGETVVTFEAANGVTAGKTVKMSDNGKVSACDEGDRFCGIALDVSEDACASVMTGGFVTVGYTGTAPEVGYGHLVADDEGGVKIDAGTDVTDEDSHSVTAYTGGEYLIVSVDTTEKTAVICL